jgi:hypothetical protein
MFLTWMWSFTCACIDTRYKEPQFTVPFDGRNEPRMISLIWPGSNPEPPAYEMDAVTIRPSGLLGLLYKIQKIFQEIL